MSTLFHQGFLSCINIYRLFRFRKEMNLGVPPLINLVIFYAFKYLNQLRNILVHKSSSILIHFQISFHIYCRHFLMLLSILAKTFFLSNYPSKLLLNLSNSLCDFPVKFLFLLDCKTLSAAFSICKITSTHIFFFPT